jgi:hypothetical protein
MQTPPQFSLLLGLLVLTSTAASAQTQTENPSRVADAPARRSDAPFATPPIAEDSLARVAGREDLTMIATASQTAGVSRNSVGDNAVTGEVRITDSAFQNMSGLSVVNVNTGNNVAINAAMNVTIAITPNP